MLQTFEAVKQAVGLDIPETIRNVSSGGLVGKAAKPADPALPAQEISTDE